MMTGLVCRSRATRIAVLLASSVAVGGFAGRARSACVAYYPFDEGSGTTVHDGSGFGHDGILVNPRGDSWATGKRGGAFYVPHIAGSGGTRVELPTDSHLAPVSAISFSAWVNTVSAYEDQPVLAKEGPNKLQYWFGLTRNQYGCLLDRDGTGAWDGEDRNQPFSSSLNGTWQHIVSTWDGTTIRHYRNGVLDPNTKAFSGSLNTGTAKLMIGLNSDYSSAAFYGRIDELYLFDHAISQSEVTQLYNLTYAVPELSTAFGAAVVLLPILVRRRREPLTED